MVMMIGKPVHFRPNNRPVSACGIEFPEHSGYDGRYTNCIRCMKTKVWRGCLTDVYRMNLCFDDNQDYRHISDFKNLRSTSMGES